MENELLDEYATWLKDVKGYAFVQDNKTETLGAMSDALVLIQRNYSGNPGYRDDVLGDIIKTLIFEYTYKSVSERAGRQVIQTDSPFTTQQVYLLNRMRTFNLRNF